MLLSRTEIVQAQKIVQAAFPRLKNWEISNEINDYYMGFCIWGIFRTDTEIPMSPRFFLTFDVYDGQWEGHLTSGQNSFFWTSADFGDARLLSSGKCMTLNDAIVALKKQIAFLCSTLLGFDVPWEDDQNRSDL